MDKETIKKNKTKDFIRTIIEEDIANNKNNGKVITRFPPEPNGYLHIGHAKAICLNFGIAKEYNGICHLRFDDTNPEKENIEYIKSIQEDIKWLGFDWGEHLYYASDYFDIFYHYAIELIKSGKAYVCHLTPEQIKEYRGTLSEPGKESPYRNRSVEENLILFEKMKNGEFKEGECVLRAKIDMAHPNINMRDPVIYRIKYMPHHRTGDKWCIYPMYDFAHCISDAVEKITHSLCTLEFEIHRPLYDWILNNITIDCHPQQIEFARLELTYTVLSKRKLLKLVNEGYVKGWDDPRMPTLSGLRRRGYTPESIKNFCDIIGIAKTNSVVDISLLEHCLRNDLNKCAQRRMAVLNPLKLVIDNYPEGKIEEIDADNNPEDPSAGTRKVLFSRNLYIERDDFNENPPQDYFRLSPGKEVRLKHAYYVTCEKVIKDKRTGEIIEIHCKYDPESRGGGTKDNRKVKGTIQWVSQDHAVNAEVRIYDYLFNIPNPGDIDDNDFEKYINKNSLKILTNCKIEQSIKNSKPGDKFQFIRHGYFCVDPDSTESKIVFNRIIDLRDPWKEKQLKKKS
jgi:glutaminyl-tRNA synthetase